MDSGREGPLSQWEAELKEHEAALEKRKATLKKCEEEVEAALQGIEKRENNLLYTAPQQKGEASWKEPDVSKKDFIILKELHERMTSAVDRQESPSCYLKLMGDKMKQLKSGLSPEMKGLIQEKCRMADLGLAGKDMEEQGDTKGLEMFRAADAKLKAYLSSAADNLMRTQGIDHEMVCQKEQKMEEKPLAEAADDRPDE